MQLAGRVLGAACTLLAAAPLFADIGTYFPRTATAGQNGTAAHPYEIADADDLVALKDAVAAGFGRDLCYRQTADIDMSGAGPFAGVGTYAADLNAAASVPFIGTYDGGGHRISSVDFTQRNYGGIFNQVKGGTIRNLTVSNITCSAFTGGEWGCSIVGNAGLGATLQGLVAEGSFGTAAKPCTHNVAGIAIRVCGGGANVETLVKDCTNNASLYGTYTKCAGITVLTQDQNGSSDDYVLFDGCVNNGTLTMSAGTYNPVKAGSDGLAGIVGYVSEGTKMRNCTNFGPMSSPLAAAKIGELVGWAYGNFLIDLGGNSGIAGKAKIGAISSCSVTGFSETTSSFSVTPYLQYPATNAMSVIWFAKGGDGEAAAISWWTAGGTMRRQTVMGTWAVALTNNVASGSDSAVHGRQYKYRHRITGLTAGTVYRYAVELASGVAYTNAFKTSPGPDSPVRFIYYNDSETQPGSTGAYETWDVSDTVIVSNTATGATSTRASRPDGVTKYYVDQTDGYASNIVRMVERRPDLYVIAGDLAAQGGKQQNWDEFWRHNAGAYNDPAGSVPILAAIGNHDLQDATPKPAGCNVNCEKPSGGEVAVEKYLFYFEVEPNGVDFSDVDARDRSQMFHRVDYGPITFIFLDTNNGDDYDVEKDTDIYLFRDPHCPANKWGLPSSRSPDFNPGSRQYTWLTNNLADAQRKAKFTFVVNHHCPYSVGYHNRTNVTESGEWLSGRAVRALTDTMLKYGVAGWLCGHDEIMEHSRIPGVETLPDGTTRPYVLNVFDMGTAGDGLRGKQITKEANRYEVFRAQKDAPEIYDQNNILVDGGKHYGHMEINVREERPGVWTATMEPVYIFVHKDANGKAAGFERRVYGDVTVLTNEIPQCSFFFTIR